MRPASAGAAGTAGVTLPTSGTGGTGVAGTAGTSGVGGALNTGAGTSGGGAGHTFGAGAPAGGVGGVGASSGAGGTGGAGSGTGGSSSATPACGLTSDRIRVTEIDVGTSLVADEDEAALHPLVISSVPSGGSRIAFMGQDGAAHMVTLDAADQPAGSALTLDVRDFADLYADDAGGVLLGTRDAQGGGNKGCGTLQNLCGNVNDLPEQFACWDMYLVRFDGTTETWATQLTESSTQSPPYLTSPTAMGRVVYIWEAYAHHGRIAFSGESYASYFGAAISVSQDCVQADTTLDVAVNIHQGDRMQVVGMDGTLLSGMGSFDWGCSHSGYERVLWDEAASRFVTVCKTDNQNRIALAPDYWTIKSVDLAANNLGDVVTATGGGYWLASSDAGGGSADVELLHFSIGMDSVTLEDEIGVATMAGVNERAPLLSAYGSDGLLVAWESGAGTSDLSRNDATRALHLQVRSRETGEAVGDALQVDGVRGNRYHALRAFPDGSAAFLAPGTSATQIEVVRVLPCEG